MAISRVVLRRSESPQTAKSRDDDVAVAAAKGEDVSGILEKQKNSPAADEKVGTRPPLSPNRTKPFLQRESSSSSSLSTWSSTTNTSTTSTSSTSLLSVRFSEKVDTIMVDNLDSYSPEEKEAAFMTEQDYDQAVWGVDCALHYMAMQQQPHDQQTTLPVHDEICFLGLDFATPLGQWIRQNLHSSSHQAVYRYQQERHHYYHQQPYSYGWEEGLAAVYIPISMQAQLLAYERGVLNAMETNQFDGASVLSTTTLVS